MGARGYPLLLASGETADGVTPLVDRQHPHDLFMELSASYSLRSGRARAAPSSMPACPASRPSARPPSCTASRSWIRPRRRSAITGSNSTHISFGVVTAGLVVGDVKLEASRFNGREPDQHRWDIETGPLDSTALRLSWNPTPEPRRCRRAGRISSAPSSSSRATNSTRWSASAIYTRPFGRERWWSTTLAWGRRDGDGRGRCWKAPSGSASGPCSAAPNVTQNDELSFAGGHHGPGLRGRQALARRDPRLPRGAACPPRDRRPLRLRFRPRRAARRLWRRPARARWRS